MNRVRRSRRSSGRAPVRAAAGAGARPAALAAGLTLGLTLGLALGPSPATGATGGAGTTAHGAVPAARTDAPAELHLVTLDGPGTVGRTGAPLAAERLRMQAQQDAVLRQVGAGEPVYRWTTALNGVAVPLTEAQARELATVPGVALVERNQVRPLAGLGGDPSAVSPGTSARGGEGVVVGLVDTGLVPDGPLFAPTSRLGRPPASFAGECEDDGWGPGACTDKVVAGHWFVEGFGRDRLASTATLSPRDDTGHGTQVASVAAGNSGVTVRLGGEDVGRYAGVAPQARIAVYKACWTAPDPDDDGCATADLVAAVDRATADGVDVLNLSVGGPGGLDTLELALLGAAEGDVVVVAAAGNDPGAAAGTAHESPWVTTVGAAGGPVRQGQVRPRGGPVLTGAMASTRPSPDARLVLAADAAADGVRRQRARLCAPGSLDAGVVAGRVVLCERGGVGRVDKSAAVAAADGVGMVLANAGGERLAADLHAVPTVHVSAADARRLVQWHDQDPRRTLRLQPLPVQEAPPRVLGFSRGGAADAATLKPDLVAPGEGVLAAVPDGWDFLGGTSAAAAWTSGAAARLLALRGWSATAVRSALVTTAEPLPGAGVLASGAGRLRAGAAEQPGLVVPVDARDYRRWAEGARTGLNTTALLVRGPGTTVRTVSNVGRQARYFSTGTEGFAPGTVRVTPAALRLDPGESARIRVRVTPAAAGDGFVVLRGGAGSTTRLPLLVSR